MQVGEATRLIELEREYGNSDRKFETYDDHDVVSFKNALWKITNWKITRFTLVAIPFVQTIWKVMPI